jgi:hypothetical protein
MKCESKSLSQFGVQPVDLGIGGIQGEPGMKPLKPEVVLLVQHHPQAILHQHRRPRPHPAIGVQACQFLADQVPLVE